jgi:hypothetical protein
LKHFVSKVILQVIEKAFNLTTTRHYPANDFATFSATKVLRNEIMGRKMGSKLPFRI